LLPGQRTAEDPTSPPAPERDGHVSTIFGRLPRGGSFCGNGSRECPHPFRVTRPPWASPWRWPDTAQPALASPPRRAVGLFAWC
jgi:hypothetical protein